MTDTIQDTTDTTTLKIKPTDALIIIDPQVDFCPGGALAVEGGNEIMPLINLLNKQFKAAGAIRVLSKDWHTSDQISFASFHGVAPFSEIDVSYGKQTMWPDHCVQGTPGAEVHPSLNLDDDVHVILKGTNPRVDSYSAFFENDHETSTGLGEWLKEKGVKRIFLVGLAYDFCVAYSAIDAVEKFKLKATIIKDATRGIGLNGSIEAAEAKFEEVGVQVIDNLNPYKD